MTDYKGVQFSFKGKRRQERKILLRRITIILLLVSILFGSYLWWQSRDLKQRMTGLLSETMTPGSFRESLPSYFLFPSARQEALAIAWCLEDIATGNNLFKKINRRSSFFDPEPILDRLLDKASPAPFIAYATFLSGNHDLSPYYEVLLKQASYVAVNDTELQSGLAKMPKKAGSVQIKERISRLNKELTEKEVVVVRDRDNRVLATWLPEKHRLKENLPGFSLDPLIPLFENGYRQIRMTVGLDLQQHAESHFRSYCGSLVLLDLESGGILAAYSKPFSKDSPANPVFCELYEPGSIIKLLTLFIYSGNRGNSLFPLECRGNMTVDGKLFYDWTVHGRIETPQQAMAFSCNLAFAKMGLELGPENMSKGLDDFLFKNGDLFGDGPFSFHLGQYRRPGDSFALANLSIGLEEIRITTVHAALISGLIASNGILPRPFLLASSDTILGLVVSREKRPAIEVHPRSMQYLTLQQSMIMAVDHPNGTARRAQNARIPPAVKTGTAGDSKLGLDAIILTFFPRHSPRYALAFRLERGGKAEYNGAIFLNQYLTDFPR